MKLSLELVAGILLMVFGAVLVACGLRSLVSFRMQEITVLERSGLLWTRWAMLGSGLVSALLGLALVLAQWRGTALSAAAVGSR